MDKSLYLCTQKCLKDSNMITTKDLYDIIWNKIANGVQKALIRNNFPPLIAERMCDAIDGKEKAEHLRRCFVEWNEMVMRQQQGILQFMREYYK